MAVEASTMCVATSLTQAEELGTFLSSQDLVQILEPGVRKSGLIKSYFVDPEEERTNNIMAVVSRISYIFLEFFPSKIVTDATIQFQRFLPDFILDFGSNKYFTRNVIARYYLALLDFRLSLVGSKISPSHIDLVRDSLGMKKSKSFTFFGVKQTQSELLAAGYIQRKRNPVFSPLLKSKVSNIVNETILYFPDKEVELARLQEKAFDLIDVQVIPRIDVDEAAFVIVSSLLSYYIRDSGIIRAYWIFIGKHYEKSVDLLKNKVYRYRSMIKKKNRDGSLGLGLNVDERSRNYGYTSNTCRNL